MCCVLKLPQQKSDCNDFMKILVLYFIESDVFSFFHQIKSIFLRLTIIKQTWLQVFSQF